MTTEITHLQSILADKVSSFAEKKKARSRLDKLLKEEKQKAEKPTNPTLFG